MKDTEQYLTTKGETRVREKISQRPRTNDEVLYENSIIKHMKEEAFEHIRCGCDRCSKEARELIAAQQFNPTTHIEVGKASQQVARKVNVERKELPKLRRAIILWEKGKR